MPTYTFNEGGTYLILLSATGSYGIKSGGARKVYITNPTVTASIATPVAMDVDTTGSAPFTVTFTNGSTYDALANPTYLWVFGSGSAPADYVTSTDANPPAQTFVDAGSYTVRLEVTSSNGVKKAAALVDILVE
jgi:PKD repeat protein